MRAKYVSIGQRVSAAYGPWTCPCCDGTMRKQPVSAKPTDRDRTRAHLYPTRHPWRRDDWFYGCRRCNHDQGHLSLEEWFLILAYRSDDRADRVLQLLKFIWNGGEDGFSKQKIETFIANVEAAAAYAMERAA